MSDSTPSVRTALAARDAAGRRHAQNVQALERAQQARAAAQAECARLAAQDEAAIERAAKRLEAQIREGNAAPLPQVTPSDRHVIAQMIADRTLKAAERAAASLEADTQRSAEDLRQAEVAIRAARNAALAERAMAITRDLTAVRDEERRLVALLAALISREVPLPEEVRTAVTSKPRPSIDWIRGGAYLASASAPIGGEPALFAESNSHWDEFIEQLESAEPSPTSAVEEAA